MESRMPSSPTPIRIQPTVLTSTAPDVAFTANARIAPTAIRKIPTPSPIKPPWVSRWIPAGHTPETRGQVVSQRRAEGLDRPADPVLDRRVGGRSDAGARARLAARVGVGRGGPDRLRLLVRDGDLHLHLLPRCRGSDLRR